MVQNKTTADEKKKKNDGMGGMVIKTNLRLSELGLAKMRNDIARQRGDAVLSLLFVFLFFFLLLSFVADWEVRFISFLRIILDIFCWRILYDLRALLICFCFG